MNIYRIAADTGREYDYYAEAVVCAETAEQAATLHPDAGGTIPCEDNKTWVNDPRDVHVELLGKAFLTERQVIVANFIRY
jgi:hypothetical protein